jgi:hypothetical protein
MSCHMPFPLLPGMAPNLTQRAKEWLAKTELQLGIVPLGSGRRRASRPQQHARAAPPHERDITRHGLAGCSGISPSRSGQRSGPRFHSGAVAQGVRPVEVIKCRCKGVFEAQTSALAAPAHQLGALPGHPHTGRSGYFIHIHAAKKTSVGDGLV